MPQARHSINGQREQKIPGSAAKEGRQQEAAGDEENRHTQISIQVLIKQ